jgi:toxin ParE1/3/4
MHIIKNPQVLDDLVDCAENIAENNEAVAIEFIDAFDNSVERLRQFPNIGTQCRFRSVELQGLRRWFVQGFEKYLIFYRVIDNTLEVVRLIHSSRDIENALQE